MKSSVSEDHIEKIKNWLGTGSINVFGILFSGKDTQGSRLAGLLDAPLIGGGDIIRSSNHDAVKKIIDAGELAPQDEYLKIVLPYLSKKEFDGKPLVLSAVGRWHGEEKAIMEAAEESGHPLMAVVLLTLSEEEVWKRWEASKHHRDRGERADDDIEALKVRLEEFKNKTLPVIDFYKEQGLSIEIDGNQSRDEVTQEIITKLAQRADNA